MLNINRIEFNTSCDKDFRILHASDSHLIFADSRDDERKIALAARRVEAFNQPDVVLNNLNETIKYANENCDIFLYSGDMIDFVSKKNLETMKEVLSQIKIPMLFAAGNHEYSLYVGEAKEDDNYRAQSFDLVQQCVPNNLECSSLEFNGLNFVSFDNSYYYFREEHLEFLKEQLKKSLPLILLLHNPLHSNCLYEMSQKCRNRVVAYLCGSPEDKLVDYPPKRIEQQKPNKLTIDFINLIKSSPNVTAIFAGHIHFPSCTYFTDKIPQFVSGGNYQGDVNEIFVRAK